MNDLLVSVDTLLNSEWGPVIVLVAFYLVFIQWLPTIFANVLSENYDRLPREVRLFLNALLPTLEDRVRVLHSRIDTYFVAKVRATDNPLDDYVYAIVSKEIAEKIDLIDLNEEARG